MKCRLLHENGIEIKLSREELHALDITYERLDYANIETRRVLWTVLDEARAQLGREIDLSSKMLIEAQSDGDGGCILDFTLLPDVGGRCKGKLVKRENLPLQLETDSADAVLDAAIALGGLAVLSLYTDGKSYRAVCESDSAQAEKIFAVLTEFGSVGYCSRVSLAFVKEHWQLLCERLSGAD